MRAYLRFRLPLFVSQSLSVSLSTAFGMSDRFVSNNYEHFHIVLADFGPLDHHQIKALNDALAIAYVQFREHPPTIKLEGFTIERSWTRSYLALKATVDPLEKWLAARSYVLRYMNPDLDLQARRPWEPCVNLGELKIEEIPKELSGTYVWQATRVELVLKTRDTDIILPWNFN